MRNYELYIVYSIYFEYILRIIRSDTDVRLVFLNGFSVLFVRFKVINNAYYWAGLFVCT